MSIEVNPVGTHCKRACLYCYELPVRQAERNLRPGPVNHAAVQAALLLESKPGKEGFSLFGGEPLLASLGDLERLWEFGLRTYGTNGVQTDGNCITDEHMALFKKYRVWVGFSIDGPGPLNDARVAGTQAQTREATDRSVAALRRCLAEGVGASLIVTLHRLNASPEQLPTLLAWVRGLYQGGLRNVRAHALEMDGGARHVSLPVSQAVEAFKALHQLQQECPGLEIDVFKDMYALLRGEDDAGTTCVWQACDPWTTPAVRGIDGDGNRTLCQRVHKDGKKWRPAQPGPLVRQVVLANTPQADGGCQGCRFITSCKGQCPGTAIGGDWRKRSQDCELWYALLEYVEGELKAQGVVPASLRADRAIIEARMLRAWGAGVPATIKGCIEDRYQNTSWFNATHGDHTDHGDAVAHGDHTDLGPPLPGLAGGEVVQ